MLLCALLLLSFVVPKQRQLTSLAPIRQAASRAQASTHTHTAQQERERKRSDLSVCLSFVLVFCPFPVLLPSHFLECHSLSAENEGKRCLNVPRESLARLCRRRQYYLDYPIQSPFFAYFWLLLFYISFSYFLLFRPQFLRAAILKFCFPPYVGLIYLSR